MTVPWFIGQDGAKHPPEVARLLAHVATGGAEGVAGPGHCKVSPLSVPGAGVRVATGGVAIVNRSAGAIAESYMDRIPVEEQVAIAATGSGAGRSDLIVRTVEDPQYGGWPAPSDPANGPYGFTRVISGVPATTESAEELDLGYPAYALARVDLPASTATVTAEMIEDLRQLVKPNYKRNVFANQPGANADLTSSAWVRWPAYSTGLTIPRWATRLAIVVTLAQVAQVAPAGSIEGTFGNLRIKYGDLIGPVTYFDVEELNAPGTAARHTFVLEATFDVTDLQGTTPVFEIQGAKNSNEDGFLRADAGTKIIVDTEFEEDIV